MVIQNQTSHSDDNIPYVYDAGLHVIWARRGIARKGNFGGHYLRLSPPRSTPHIFHSACHSTKQFSVRSSLPIGDAATSITHRTDETANDHAFLSVARSVQSPRPICCYGGKVIQQQYQSMHLINNPSTSQQAGSVNGSLILSQEDHHKGKDSRYKYN